MTSNVRLSISVQDSHLDKIDEIAAAAERAGMRVEQRLGSLGVITGSIAQKDFAGLHRITGVSSVEEERTLGVPRPGSPVQ